MPGVERYVLSNYNANDLKLFKVFKKGIVDKLVNYLKDTDVFVDEYIETDNSVKFQSRCAHDIVSKLANKLISKLSDDCIYYCMLENTGICNTIFAQSKNESGCNIYTFDYYLQDDKYSKFILESTKFIISFFEYFRDINIKKEESNENLLI